ncbi:MAG: hypothetical protein C4523_10620 [Myxococcales bacterium]|nr:MAG: hypothetical protein C4523_10620 [Myxococcales bacterium]
MAALSHNSTRLPLVSYATFKLVERGKVKRFKPRLLCFQSDETTGGGTDHLMVFVTETAFAVHDVQPLHQVIVSYEIGHGLPSPAITAISASCLSE